MHHWISGQLEIEYGHPGHILDYLKNHLSNQFEIFTRYWYIGCALLTFKLVGNPIWPPEPPFWFSFTRFYNSTIWTVDSKFLQDNGTYQRMCAIELQAGQKSNMAARLPSFISFYVHYLKNHLSNHFEIHTRGDALLNLSPFWNPIWLLGFHLWFSFTCIILRTIWVIDLKYIQDICLYQRMCTIQFQAGQNSNMASRLPSSLAWLPSNFDCPTVVSFESPVASS